MKNGEISLSKNSPLVKWANIARTIEITNSATRKLISKQGPNGERPWLLDVPTGRVVDFYEVYSGANHAG